MKRNLFAIVVLLGLTVSCAPTATPQQQIALATATVQIPTVTPTPTDTPTLTPTITPSPTSTSTATNTPTPTRTSTPTITPTPPQTPIPKFIWKSDSENGFSFAGLLYIHRQGGTAEIISDPTSSGRGQVMRQVIGSGGALEEKPGVLVYRLHPDIYFSFKPAPCEIKNDIWLSKELVQTATIRGNLLVVGPDFVDKSPQDGGDWHSALQAVLNDKSILRGKVYLRLYHSPPGELGPIESSAPEFTPEQWHTVSIFLEQNREVRLYQDGLLVGRGTLTEDSRVGTVGGHSGLYFHHWYNIASSPPKGMFLLDNYEIRCW